MTNRGLVQKAKALVDASELIGIDSDRTQPAKLEEMQAAFRALEEAIELDGAIVFYTPPSFRVNRDSIAKTAKTLIAVSSYVVIDTKVTQPLKIKELHIAFDELVDAIREIEGSK